MRVDSLTDARRSEPASLLKTLHSFQFSHCMKKKIYTVPWAVASSSTDHAATRGEYYIRAASEPGARAPVRRKVELVAVAREILGSSRRAERERDARLELGWD